ncbi:MAG: TetR family transcriptional regulator [Comamonas sp.]|nr:TetR family transcriptional regulator [Comamonas sp.]
MARGRAAGYDEQREQILQQAAALFASQGYAATSMNEVAQACGLSKPAIYHYFRDKYALLLEICDAHLTRLQALESEVRSESQLSAEQRLRGLIQRFVREYAQATSAHRVLTESVRHLQADDRQRVLDKERALVAGFSEALIQIRPDLDQAGLSKALTMLLFGMMNWMFTWLRSGGALDHEDMAPVVADLFMGGIGAVKTPIAKAEKGLVKN